MAFCSGCGAAIADGTTMCGTCSAKAPVAASGGGLSDNIAGLLCYSPVGIIADIIFLVAEPYNKNKFIRFHAFQSLFTALGLIILGFVLGVVLGIFVMIPVVGWIIDVLLWAAFILGNITLWVVMMIKAYQMQTVRLPFVGDLAAKQAGM